MGARGAEVAELWASDRESLAALEPVLGLVFLFKWQKEEDARPVDAAYAEKGIFFAAQVQCSFFLCVISSCVLSFFPRSFFFP